VIVVKNLSISFKTESSVVKAVNGVNFQVEKGMALGIVGESGSGKSVTALAIMQLLPQQAVINSGSIIFGGKELLGLGKNEIRKYRGNKISMIFQEPMTSLNPVMRCGKQVLETIQLHQKLDKGKATKQVLELFERVKLPRPEEIYRAYPHEISGGQKQRVMIAMAVANKPDLLIADEPTTALDVTVQKEIISLLNVLRADFGMSLIFISHDLGVVSAVADKVAVMYKGEIVETGLTSNIFNNPQHPYTQGLLACRPPLDVRLSRLPEIQDFMDSENKEDFHLKIKQSTESATERKQRLKLLYSKPVLVDVKNLNKEFILKRSLTGKTISALRAVYDVSLQVFPGETLGLVGESGCGKTTLGRSILRLIEPDSGTIFFNENNILALNSAKMKAERKNLNIVFQDPYSSLNPHISIGNAIKEPMSVHRLLKNNAERKQKVYELLEKVGLKPEHYDRYPHEFSGGQRQRIVIARALAVEPRFIICDEAVSALDVSVQARILNLLNDLKKEFGFTYIFISHDLSVVRFMSDRILVMKNGQIIEAGDADEVYENPQNPYTSQLIDSIPKANLSKKIV
jgi:peptide/nickel transport system ATP-binding protein